MFRIVRAIPLIMLTACATQPRPDFYEGLKAYDAQDFERAYEIWFPLAEDGHARAQHAVGEILMEAAQEFHEPWATDFGDGPDAYARGLAWTEKAADQGLVFAMRRLADQFRTVYYVRQRLPSSTSKPQYRTVVMIPDAEKALYWWRRAANRGDYRSTHNLSTAYGTSKIEQYDLIEGAKWAIIFDTRICPRPVYPHQPSLHWTFKEMMSEEDYREAERRAKAWRIEFP